MTESPERVTFSIPPDDELDADELDELVAESEHDSRSELIRELIKSSGGLDE